MKANVLKTKSYKTDSSTKPLLSAYQHYQSAKPLLQDPPDLWAKPLQIPFPCPMKRIQIAIKDTCWTERTQEESPKSWAQGPITVKLKLKAKKTTSCYPSLGKIFVSLKWLTLIFVTQKKKVYVSSKRWRFLLYVTLVNSHLRSVLVLAFVLCQVNLKDLFISHLKCYYVAFYGMGQGWWTATMNPPPPHEPF